MSLEYKQVQPPEGINVSMEHPLKEFSFLLISVLLLFVVAVTTISFAVHLLSPLIPFSAEQKIAKVFVDKVNKEYPNENIEITHYLQTLADSLTKVEGLPGDMSITVHYIDSDTINAFATLGGNLFFFRGLLENVPSENALQMVMAHEIAHIKHRHPIKALGRSVIISSVIAFLNISVGNSVMGNIFGDAGLLTALQFSREHEEQADETAMAALVKLNGHIGGADSLFEILRESNSESLQLPEFFSSHPHMENRVANFSLMAEQHGWQTSGPLTALPAQFNEWINAKK